MKVRVVRSRDGRIVAAYEVEYAEVQVEPAVESGGQVEVVDVAVPQFADVANFLASQATRK
jgi:hypothetical protein